MLGMFWDDGAGWGTVHFPGQSLHGEPLFRTSSFPVRSFPSLGHSGPHQSSSLELLTHNLLLAPAGFVDCLDCWPRYRPLKLS